MSSFGGVTSASKKNTKKSKKNKKQKSYDQFDVSSALLRSEKLYDQLTTQCTKSMLNDDDGADSSDNTVLSEFLVAARYRYSPSSQQQQRPIGSSSVSDWTPIAQICLLRSRNSCDDGRIPPQLIEAVSVNCREIHHAAVISAPIFASLPRNQIQYSVEPVESFNKFVYDIVIEDMSSTKKRSNDAMDNMTTKEARLILDVDEGCTDLGQIKRAYRSLSFKYHPDRLLDLNSAGASGDNSNANDVEKKKAMDLYVEVKNAYEFLIRSGVTAAGKSSSATSPNSVGSNLSWYESLGGKERTDFKGPIELVPLKEAQCSMDRCVDKDGGYRSAIAGLDPELVMNFVARNQANAVMVSE